MHQKSNLELKELEYKASELRIAVGWRDKGLSRTNNGRTLIRENPVECVIRPTLLRICSEAVSSAPISNGNPAQKYWIPPYQARGTPGQARNDDPGKGTFESQHWNIQETHKK